jgi:hypothetical protein
MVVKIVTIDDYTEKEIPQGIPYYELQFTDKDTGRWLYYHSTDLTFITNTIKDVKFERAQIYLK